MSFNIGRSMKSPARGANRDIGLSGGSAGKGDANRSFSKEFNENMQSALESGSGWKETYAKRVVKNGKRTTYVY